MKNSWNNWWNNFFEWPENKEKKVVSDTKKKVYWVYFIESTYSKLTGKISEEYIYSALSEEDYNKVLETKHTINTQNCVDVLIKDEKWITQKTMLLVDKIHLIH